MPFHFGVKHTSAIWYNKNKIKHTEKARNPVLYPKYDSLLASFALPKACNMVTDFMFLYLHSN